MSNNLLQHLQGKSGFYNALPTPFMESFSQKSYDGREFEIHASMYPVVNFEFLTEYENRKSTESSIRSMQRHGPAGYPAIAQSRYSRIFDFPGESQLGGHLSRDEDCPESVQSARALFEYACGDVDTLSLDRQQTSILENRDRSSARVPHLIVVDPLWIIVFPKSSIISLFRVAINIR